MIDLRSDTQSLPTPKMRDALANARLGDETFSEDPTVNELEEVMTTTFGFESAMLGISATMCNLISLMNHCPAGSEALLDRDVHVLRAEAGGISTIAGVVPTVVESQRGHPTPSGVRDALHPVTIVTPRPVLLWLENTHNRAGGTVMAVADQIAVAEVARQSGLKVHLDGARIFNAAVAQGVSLREAAMGPDSLTVDLTKTLSCPLGAVLLGTQTFIEAARRQRRLLGGGMRQAGVIAAPAIAALADDFIGQVVQEHRLARTLAMALSDIDGYQVDPSLVETNMVYVNVRQLGRSFDVALALKDAGVLVSQLPPWHIRLVTYRGITDASVSEAVAAMAQVAKNITQSENPRAQEANSRL